MLHKLHHATKTKTHRVVCCICVVPTCTMRSSPLFPCVAIQWVNERVRLSEVG